MGDAQARLAATDEETRRWFSDVGVAVATRTVLDELSVESCDAREREVRDALQGEIDAKDRVRVRLVEKIVKAMQEYPAAYPVDTREADAAVEAAGEYETMLSRLRGDDLPRFEPKFKALLNENTTREVAAFQAFLQRAERTIRERIDVINGSLRKID